MKQCLNLGIFCLILRIGWGGEFEPMTLQSIRRAEPFKQFSA